MNQPHNVPPARIPVLTEVLEASHDDDERTQPMLDAELAPSVDVDASVAADRRAPQLEDEALVARVLEALHGRFDAVIDRRVQAALEPIWRRLTEDLADEARLALALSLRETLREAVRDEIRRTFPASPPASDAD